jgi:hypothetical protein
MRAERLDTMREGVLARMERADRNMKLAIFGAVLLESVFLAVVLLLIDLENRVERLIFVTSILGYTIIALGLAALGAHVTRSMGRILTVLSDDDRPS